MNMIQMNNDFIDDIENLCRSKYMDYIDAVVMWCESNKVEVEYIGNLIKKDIVMKSKIQLEAENLNVLKRSARLPV
jgi:hypothetical protein